MAHDIELSQFQFDVLKKLYDSKTPVIVAMEPKDSDPEKDRHAIIFHQVQYDDLVKHNLFKDVTEMFKGKLDSTMLEGRRYKVYSVTNSAIEIMALHAKGVTH